MANRQESDLYSHIRSAKATFDFDFDFDSKLEDLLLILAV